MSYRTTTAVALALAAPMLGLTACNPGEQEKSVETVTMTKDSATSTENSESPTARNQKSSSQQTSKSSEQANDRPASNTRTQDGDSTSNGKNIARCAKSSEGLYEQGTTWFTDGTTGWTQYCSNIF